MSENLRYELATNVAATGSYDNGNTFSFTPTSCSTNGACAMNGNTGTNTRADDATGETGTFYYYSWYAATARVGTSSSKSDINGSICPAHWRMPHNYTYTADKSFGQLLIKYGLSSDGKSYVTTDGTVLDSTPVSFSRVRLANQGKYLTGGDGYFWTSTAYSNSGFAYGFQYNASYVYPHNDLGKYMGLPVRCVAI